MVSASIPTPMHAPTVPPAPIWLRLAAVATPVSSQGDAPTPEELTQQSHKDDTEALMIPRAL